MSPSTHQPSPKVAEAVEKIAREFHDEYEAWAQAKGWETQEATRTSFDDLPAENRETMLATVQALIDRKIISVSVTESAERTADRRPVIERLNHLAREIAVEKPHDPYVAETVVALDEAIALLKSPGIPVSALLSDEAKARMLDVLGERGWHATATPDEAAEPDLAAVVAKAHRDLGDALQATIEHVGGAK